MRATATVVVEPVPGGSRYETLRSDPPLLLRPTPDALQLVGGAAGPLGGDDLGYCVTVGAGASLAVRSPAASMVLPGAARSALSIDARVGDHATLDWAPEPLISVTASHHRQRTDIDLAPTARLRWREVVALGCTEEPPGILSSVLRVERDGAVLCHNELRVGDGAEGWAGAAGLGGARVVVTEVVVGPGAHETATSFDGATRAGLLGLAPDASLRVALGVSLGSVLALLADLG